MPHKEGSPGKLLLIQPKASGTSRIKTTSCCWRLQVTSEQLAVGMVLQRNRTNRMHIYIKKLAQMIMKVGKFQSLLVGTQELLMLQFNSQG